MPQKKEKRGAISQPRVWENLKESTVPRAARDVEQNSLLMYLVGAKIGKCILES